MQQSLLYTFEQELEVILAMIDGCRLMQEKSALEGCINLTESLNGARTALHHAKHAIAKIASERTYYNLVTLSACNSAEVAQVLQSPTSPESGLAPSALVSRPPT